jgi:predicted permease
MIDSTLRPTGAVLMGAVGLVLLVACANLASMLLARGVSRAKEMALRSALGASRGRVARQLIVENVMLAATGGVVGLGLASMAMRLTASFHAPVEVPISLALNLDLRVVLFTAALSVVTGLTFGLLPALRASRADLIPALKSDPSLSASPGRRFGLGPMLVVAQVAVSIVLIVGGLLLSRSLLASQRLDLGFRPDGIGMATVGLDFNGYSPERGQQFYDLAQQRIARLPGVESVALSERMPLSNNVQTTQIVIDGHPEMTPATGLSIDATQVSATYFQTIGVRLTEGRVFDDRDTPQTQRVAVVSQAFAKRFWPNDTAVGKRLRMRDDKGPAVEIVGVVSDYKIRTVGETPRPILHFARAQRYQPYATILARTHGDAGELVRGMQRELYGIEPALVLMDSGPFDKLIAMSLFPVRAGAALIGGLAALAMLLAGVGLYGVMAFGVSRRTREIGIRMALGANRALVARQVMGQGLLLVGIGGAVGIALAALGAQALTAVLNGVTPLDPASYAGAIGVLAVAAGAACYVPARRAASVDPLRALRQL